MATCLVARTSDTTGWIECVCWQRSAARTFFAHGLDVLLLCMLQHGAGKLEKLIGLSCSNGLAAALGVPVQRCAPEMDDPPCVQQKDAGSDRVGSQQCLHGIVQVLWVVDSGVYRLPSFMEQ